MEMNTEEWETWFNCTCLGRFMTFKGLCSGSQCTHFGKTVFMMQKSLYTAQSLPLADKAGVANSSLPNLAVGIHGSLGCHVGCSNCGVVVLSQSGYIVQATSY